MNLVNMQFNSHAYAIYGRDSAIRTNYTNQLIDKIYCESNSTLPCNSCSGCCARKSSLDFIKIEDEKSIKTEEIRTLIKEISNFPIGNKRVVLINNADNMTLQAQNSLLKTLEEPPEKTVFILTGIEINFLPTIRSRCSAIRVPNNSVISTPFFLLAQELAWEIINGNSNSFSAKLLENKECLAEIFSALIALMRDKYAVTINVAPSFFNLEDLSCINFSDSNYLKIMEFLQQSLSNIQTNINRQLVCDSLAINIFSVFR